MKTIFILIFILALTVTGALAFFMPLGIGVWGNNQPVGYAIDIPIFLVLFILLLVVGLFYLTSIFRSA